MYSIPVNQLSHNKPTQVVSQTWTKLIRAGNMTVVYFPFYLTAIFKVLNYLCFVGLHWQNVCLQSRLLTWYFMYLTLLFFLQCFFFFSEPANNEYVASGGCLWIQDTAKKIFLIFFKNVVIHFVSETFMFEDWYHSHVCVITRTLEPESDLLSLA